HVPAFVRTGTPFMRMDSGREAAYAVVVQALGKMFAEAATELATRLDLHAKKILDIGCGSGVWSLALAARDPAARVTGHDLAPDRVIARAIALEDPARVIARARIGGERRVERPQVLHPTDLTEHLFGLREHGEMARPQGKRQPRHEDFVIRARREPEALVELRALIGRRPRHRVEIELPLDRSPARRDLALGHTRADRGDRGESIRARRGRARGNTFAVEPGRGID